MLKHVALIAAIVAVCTVQKTQCEQCFSANEGICMVNYPKDDYLESLERWVCKKLGDNLPSMRNDLITQKNQGVGFIDRHLNSWSTLENWDWNYKFDRRRRAALKKATSRKNPKTLKISIALKQDDKRDDDYNQHYYNPTKVIEVIHSSLSCPKKRLNYIECYSSICYGIGTDCDDFGSTFAQIKEARYTCKGDYGSCMKIIVKPHGKAAYAVIRKCGGGSTTDGTYKTANLTYTVQSCVGQLCNAEDATYQAGKANLLAQYPERNSAVTTYQARSYCIAIATVLVAVVYLT